MAKKILFVGAGAIGSYIGAFLSRAGHDVTLVDPWAEQVEMIRKKGISVTGPHDPFEAHPKAVHLGESQRMPRDFDLAFVAMKVYDTAWAAQVALRHLKADGFIVASENCWPDPIVASVAGTPGEARSGVASSGIAWREVGRAIPLHLAAESARVGLALGYRVPKFNGTTAEQWAAADRREVYDSLDRMLTSTSAGGRNWRSSMGQDVTKGRPTEIDYMNGYVVAQGRERGVATPVAAATVDIVRQVDAGTRKPEAQNIGLVLKRAGV